MLNQLLVLFVHYLIYNRLVTNGHYLCYLQSDKAFGKSEFDKIYIKDHLYLTNIFLIFTSFNSELRIILWIAWAAIVLPNLDSISVIKFTEFTWFPM